MEQQFKDLPWWCISLIIMGGGFMVQGLVTVLFQIFGKKLK